MNCVHAWGVPRDGNCLRLAEHARCGFSQQKVIAIPDNFKLVILVLDVLPFA